MRNQRRIHVAAFCSVMLVTSATVLGDPPQLEGEIAFGSRATIPVAWGDFDDDGDQDLAVGNFFNQANELYVNDGAGSFTQRNEFGAGQTFAMAWADFDNDGDLDMAVGNDGQNVLYVNNGEGTFVQQVQFGVSRTVAVAWGDADGDGYVDLAIGNGILGVSQQNYLYLNDGDGTFTGLTRFGAGQTGSVAWGDADGDGDLDLAVGNGGFGSSGANALFRNEGGGLFPQMPRFGQGDTAAVAWADADGDGDLDLAVANWNSQQNRLYENACCNVFNEASAFGARDTNTIAWGDYDLDGDLDLAVGNGDFTSADQNYVYENDGAGVFGSHASLGLGSTDGVAWADIDGDGDLDTAVGNEHTPTQNQLWVNTRSRSSYLRLRLVGQHHEHGDGYSNRDGIGAWVTVYEAGHLGDAAYRLGFRQIESKGGFSAENAMEPTFGTPGHDAVDVRIVWPGSAGVRLVQELRGVATEQRAIVVERRPGDVNDDGVVDVDDLMAVILTWGPCQPPPVACAADLDGNGVVDVDDLVQVIVEWTG